MGRMQECFKKFNSKTNRKETSRKVQAQVKESIRIHITDIVANTTNWVDSAQDRDYGESCEYGIELTSSISHGVSQYLRGCISHDISQLVEQNSRKPVNQEIKQNGPETEPWFTRGMYVLSKQKPYKAELAELQQECLVKQLTRGRRQTSNGRNNNELKI